MGFYKYLIRGLSASNPAVALTVVGVVSGYLLSRGLCGLALTTFFAAIDYCLGPDEEDADGGAGAALAQLQRLTSGLGRTAEAY